MKKRVASYMLFLSATLFPYRALAIMALAAGGAMIIACSCNPWNISSVNYWVVTHVNTHVDRWKPDSKILIENDDCWQIYDYSPMYGRFIPTGIGHKARSCGG